MANCWAGIYSCWPASVVLCYKRRNNVVLPIEAHSRDPKFSPKGNQSYDPHSKPRGYTRVTFAFSRTITVGIFAEPRRFVCFSMLLGSLSLSVISRCALRRKQEEAIAPRANSPVVVGIGCQNQSWGYDFGNSHSG